jgi:hypothetical protein
MIVSNWRKALVPIVLSVALLFSACSSKEPSKYAATQKETAGRNAPVFSQEKGGISLAKLNKGGKNVAMLAISDTISLPAAAKKYEKSTSKIGNYPLLDEAQLKSTGVLVNNRYQVKVTSKDPSFTAADRKAWLEKFNLNGLSKLK